MSQPVLVRGWISANAQIVFWFLRVVFVLAVLISLFPGKNDDPEVVRVAFLVVLSAWLLSESIFWITFLTRAWVRDLGESFEYITRFSKAEYKISDVSALSILPNESVWEMLSLSSKSNFNRDRINLRIDNGPVLFWDIRYREALNPIEPLIRRIDADFMNRVSETLNRGGALEGKNWKFDQTGFHHPDRNGFLKTFAPDELIVELILDDICLWTLDSEQAMLLDDWKSEPICRIPIRTKNGSVLLKLLQTAVPIRKPEPHRPGVIGRHLLDIKPGLFIFLLLAVVFPFLGYALAEIFGVIGMIIGVIPVLIALFSFVMLFIPRRTQVYSRGVKRIWFNSMWVLYYEDVEAFTFWMVTHYTNGLYTHTEIQLKLTALPDRESKNLELSSFSCFSQVRQFSILVDYLSKPIARRMRKELDETGGVAWVSGITLAKDCIQYRNPQAKSWEVSKLDISYENIKSFGSSDGLILNMIYETEKEGSFRSLNIGMGSPNYQAGLELLRELLPSSQSVNS